MKKFWIASLICGCVSCWASFAPAQDPWNPPSMIGGNYPEMRSNGYPRVSGGNFGQSGLGYPEAAPAALRQKAVPQMNPQPGRYPMPPQTPPTTVPVNYQTPADNQVPPQNQIAMVEPYMQVNGSTQQIGTQQFGTQPTGTQPTGTQPTATQQTGTQQTGTQQTGTQQTAINQYQRTDQISQPVPTDPAANVQPYPMVDNSITSQGGNAPQQMPGNVVYGTPSSYPINTNSGSAIPDNGNFNNNNYNNGYNNGYSNGYNNYQPAPNYNTNYGNGTYGNTTYGNGTYGNGTYNTAIQSDAAQSAAPQSGAAQPGAAPQQGNSAGVGQSYVNSNCGPAGMNGCGSCGDGGCDGGCDDGRLFGRFGRLNRHSCGDGSNTVVSVNGLYFSRDFESDRGLGFNSLSQYLFSTDATNDHFGGVETAVSRRSCNGSGYEIRYWGLYPDQADYTFGNTPYTSLGGLSQIYFTPNAITALQIYNSATSHRIYRDNEFHNVEINMLRNGGSYCGMHGKQVYYEVLGGFRWFQFNEDFRYAAFNTGGGNYPGQFNYDVSTENTLLGFQLGSRTERCFTKRARLAIGVKGGLFNNRISHRQSMGDSAGNLADIYAGPFNGTMYDFMSTKNDFSMMSEFDVGLIYQVSCNARFNFGYRALGITGLALAPDQIPYNFTDANDIERIESNSSMILHGAYSGFQFCY